MRSNEWLLAAVMTVLLAGSASAGIIDGAGNVTDWGLTPFSQPNQSDVQYGNRWSTISNDYSPINYPGVGHVPSPGLTSGGEVFDLEELHVRSVGQWLQALVVTSSALSTVVSGETYYLGDLFLTINGNQYGVVTQSANQGLAAGSVYRLTGSGDVQVLQNNSRSYAGSKTLVDNDYGPNATIPEVAGPWAVKGSISADQLLGAATISTDTFNYGGREDNTFLIEYTLNTALLGLSGPMDLTTKIAWGCGNDVIRIRNQAHGVPEPATVGLLAFGAVFFVLSRRPRLSSSVR